MQRIVLYSLIPSLNIEFYYFKWTQANCGGESTHLEKCWGKANVSASWRRDNTPSYLIFL